MAAQGYISHANGRTLDLACHLGTRASESILLTLAEGSAKPTAKDRARYYSMALGSFRESQVILSLAGERPRTREGATTTVG